ncbi:universal stress protein [Streptomyces sp. RS10V-4]|uniref:universal stress protein n=1 Tax=Streptomyces rhizoryzae TaxID=2932493 RepID=UPI002003E8A9|nr:universal stress protein [Streptomyces rhizoryzae]MCK7624337.1 universal stress protein [Streptomyces rhizoryzae]
MGGTVLVGLDGTGNSVPAVRWGAAEAAARHLRLHLLHSWTSQPGPAAPGHEDGDRRRYGATVLERAEAMVGELHPGLPVTAELAGEEAADALAERSPAAALLVLGSRGHDTIAGFLLGSVSLRVLGRAECPVVTVREEECAAGPGPEVVAGIQEVGCEGDPVLDYAFTTAAAHRARLRAVRAWVPATAPGAPYRELTTAVDEAERAAVEREGLAACLAPWREKFPEVPVTEQVAGGRTVPVLLRACTGAGLLVIGRRPHRAPMPLGPAVLALLHHSRCPVAVVPRTAGPPA